MREAVPALPNVTGARNVTITAHTHAVEDAIQTMQSHLQEALMLEDLASVACLSPAHFTRVFRRLIGVPPVEYLTALRFQRARHLLLMTSLTITDVCFEVGFTSPGTFTSRFTRRVGLSPRQLRQRAERFEPIQGVHTTRRPKDVKDTKDMQDVVAALGRGMLCGSVEAPASFQGTIYVGLFASPIPQGWPVRCARLTAPGRYLMADLADGVYYLRAAAFPLASDRLASLLPTEHLLLGNTPGPLLIHQGRAMGELNLTLRPPRLGDPPLVMGLPLL